MRTRRTRRHTARARSAIGAAPARCARSAATRGWLAAALLLAAGTIGCGPGEPARDANEPRAPEARTTASDAAGGTSVERIDGSARGGDGAVELTLLFTTDEHGWILPHVEAGLSRGGVSRLFHQFTVEEQHCAGPAPSPALGEPSREAAVPIGGAAPARTADAATGPCEAKVDPCIAAHTLLLSGGDSFTGPAISGHFRGATMAQAMGRLGYAASAIGNHELDYGWSAFRANRCRSGARYLAANVVQADGRPSDLGPPFVVVQRAGAQVGIIGVATPDTPRLATASRFEGLRFDDIEPTLDRVVPLVWQAGADVVLVLAHECADRVAPVLERHPEWQISFVGTGHCHGVVQQQAGGATLMSPGWRLERYARARLRVRLDAQGPRQAELVSAALVEVRAGSSADAPRTDPLLDAWLSDWQREIDRELGDVVAVSTTGLGRESDELARWVLRSWLEHTEAEVAVTTRGSIRQELPAGPVTVATIHSILPFENELVVASVPGTMLRAMAAEPATRMLRVARGPNGRIGARQALTFDEARSYRVVTTDYLYEGGDDCPFRKADPNARRTGVHWRAPVVSWTRSLGSSQAKPLEHLLRAAEGAGATP